MYIHLSVSFEPAAVIISGFISSISQVQKSFSNPLSNTMKDTSTVMRNPLPELCREGLRMIVLVSLIVLLRGLPCFHDFSHGASHPYIPIHNDFCTST